MVIKQSCFRKASQQLTQLISFQFFMSKTQRKWDIVPPEKKREFLQEVIGFFKRERDQDIGLIAAENVLDFFSDLLGPHFHNKAVQDAKNIIQQALDNVEVDLSVLLDAEGHK